MGAIARLRSGRIRWWLYGKPTGLLETLVADPDAVLRGPSSVARTRTGRKRFFRVAGDPGEGELYVKVFELPEGAARLRYVLRPSKARREAAVARRLEARGVEAAGPIAVGEERRLGVLARSLSVIEVRRGRDLRALLSDRAVTSAERRAALDAFADCARRLHDAGVDQDDFSPNNFLWLDSGNMCLLDLERCRVGRPLGARRWLLLAKLHRHDLRVSRAARLRFLARYLGPQAGRRERREAWSAIERAFRQVRRRDARRAARAAFEVGRNLVHEGDVWVVRGRESLRVLRQELPPGQARRAWITAHQLERLGLPALRPVRLGPAWIELEAPSSAAPSEGQIGRAARRLAAFGSLVRPAWALAQDAAVLTDPLAFRLEI